MPPYLSLLNFYLFIYWLHHKACGILASRPGIEPVFYALEGRVLTTGPPGKSFLISLDRFLGLRFLGKKDIQVFIFGITLLMSSPVGAQSLSCVRLFVTPWTVGSQNFPGQNTGVGCHSLLQGIFLTQRLNPCLLCLLNWQVDSLPIVPPGKPQYPLSESLIYACIMGSRCFCPFKNQSLYAFHLFLIFFLTPHCLEVCSSPFTY